MGLVFTAGGADQALDNAEKRCRLLDIVEGCERHGLDDLLVTVGVASQPNALIKARHMGEASRASRRRQVVWCART